MKSAQEFIEPKRNGSSVGSAILSAAKDLFWSRVDPSGASRPQDDRKLRTAWGLLIIALVTIVIVQGWRSMTRAMIDFSVVYRTGERILQGKALYDFSDGIMLFKYAPCIGYVLAPLAFFPKAVSAFLFFLLSVTAFAAIFHKSWQWAVPKGQQGWTPWLILTLTILSTLRVIMNSLDFGQVQVFILLGMLYVWGAFTDKHWLRGGLVLALLTLSKIVPGVLCLPWLVRGQWRPAAATAAIGLALLAVPALWLGPSGAIALTTQWWHTLQVSTDQSMLERWTNQSLLSAFARIFAPNHYYVNWFNWDMPFVIVMTKGILDVWLGCLLVLGLRRKEDGLPSHGFAQALELSTYLLFIIVAFPLAWRYHFTSMIVPNMVVLCYLLIYARRDYLVWLLFGTAMLLNSGVNQEILGSRLFEWFHLRSCLTVAVLLTFAALLRIERRLTTEQKLK